MGIWTVGMAQTRTDDIVLSGIWSIEWLGRRKLCPGMNDLVATSGTQ
jgi:hypothetical protein